MKNIADTTLVIHNTITVTKYFNENRNTFKDSKIKINIVILASLDQYLNNVSGTGT